MFSTGDAGKIAIDCKDQADNQELIVSMKDEEGRRWKFLRTKGRPPKNFGKNAIPLSASAIIYVPYSSATRAGTYEACFAPSASQHRYDKAIAIKPGGSS